MHDEFVKVTIEVKGANGRDATVTRFMELLPGANIPLTIESLAKETAAAAWDTVYNAAPRLTIKNWYVWTSGHGGATGEGPSGPICKRIFARTEEEAREKASMKLTSWDGEIKKVTDDPNYSPRKEYIW